MLYEEHDGTVLFVILLVEFLLSHRSVSDKANELPFIKVYDLLRDVQCQMHNAELSVLRRIVFVRKHGILNMPGLV